MILRPVVKPIWRPAIRSVLDVGRGSDIPLDLDWSSGVLVSRISGGAAPSFSRASSATRITQTGLVQMVAPNVMAVDWVPALGGWAARLEEQKTNFCKDSNFQGPSGNSQLGWFPQVSSIYTQNAATSPDGTITAARLQGIAATSSGIFHQMNSAAAISAGSFVFSLWVKSNVPGVPQNFALSNYNTTDGSAQQNFVATDNWQRITYTRVNSASTFRQVNVVSTGSAAYDIQIWGAQVETNGLSSFIPTAGAEAVRQTDTLTLPTSGWWNKDAGTFLAEVGYYPGNIVTTFGREAFYMAASSNDRLNVRLAFASSNVYPMGAIGNGTNVTARDAGTSAPGPNEKLGLAYSSSVVAVNLFSRGGQSNSFGVAFSGVATGVIQVGNNLGYIRRFRYWNNAKTAAELNALTT